MKTLNILFLLLAVIFSGFSKDSESTKAGVTVPTRFDGVIIQNFSSLTVCTPTGEPYPKIAHARTGWLSGNQTHGGRLITEQSTWTIVSCSTDFTTGINTSYVEGVNTVANGDSYFYTAVMQVDGNTGHVILNITIDGGTGRYEGASGYSVLTGYHTETSVPISGWGSVTFPR